MLAFCFVLLFFLPCSLPVSGQSVDELPEYATWRFGKSADANGIYRLSYSPNGKLLATRNRKNIVKIFDVESKKQLCEVEGHENNWVETIDFSPDSKFFMTAAGSSEKVKVWNSQTGKLESEIETDAIAAYFSPSGDSINVLGETHVERYTWPGVQKTNQQKWKSGNETRTAMSRDGRVVISYRSVNRTVYRTQVLDLENKSKIQLDGPTGIPKSVALSANGNWIAASYHRDQNIRLWDLRDPHQKKYTLKRHNETVQSISFSPDSRFLVSSGWDETVVAWDILTRQPITQFFGHSEHVNATAFSPIGLQIASGASGTTDTSTIVWDFKEMVLLPKVTPPERGFDQVWKSLGSNTLNASLKATAEFLAGGEEYLALIEKRVGKSIAENTVGSIDESIKLLDHPEWAVREKAMQQLLGIRVKADRELRQALKQASSPEVKFRISQVLKKTIERPKVNIVETRRWGRIVFVLEHLNTERSQKLLNRIASSTLNIDVAQDARDSFARNNVKNQ
jgi:WD40 repeat protein